tara:strand:+ start:167 stop:607 length:441 start_codon:yes stop_codon:yes gene_type:complete
METVWQEHNSAKQLLQNSNFASLEPNQLKLIKGWYNDLATDSFNRTGLLGKVYTYESGNVVADQCATTEKHLADIAWLQWDTTMEKIRGNSNVIKWSGRIPEKLLRFRGKSYPYNTLGAIYKVQWYPGEGFYSATYFSQQPVSALV